MPSQPQTAFDDPYVQTSPPVPSRNNQVVEEYDNQQIMLLPPNSTFIANIHSSDFSSSYLHHFPQPAQYLTGQTLASIMSSATPAVSERGTCTSVPETRSIQGLRSHAEWPHAAESVITAQLFILHQHYTIVDDDRTFIELLATEPELCSLLIEAVEPLRHTFGDKRLIYIRIQSSDEDSILKVTVRLPTHFGDNPEDALQAFNKEWWLKNCHRSSGALVFDYEMQHAI